MTPHSYRYAWAERGADTAYPERYAQRVLGQNSKIVHRAHAKKAQGELPSLEDYEEAKKSGKILFLKPETKTPLKMEEPGPEAENPGQSPGAVSATAYLAENSCFRKWRETLRAAVRR